MEEHLTTAYGEFMIDPVRDKKIADILRRGEHHQKDILEFLLHIVPKGGVVVDVGAHIGTVSVPLARQGLKVISFEPSPESYNLLVTNAGLNHVAVDARNNAVGERRERATLETPHGGNAGANTLLVGEGSVSVVTLDDEIEHADAIKIDVEGMELMALEGSSNLIDRSRPVVCLEINLPRLRANQVALSQLDTFFRMRKYELLWLHQGELSKVHGSRLSSFMLAPGATLRGRDAAPFDLIAVPKEKVLDVVRHGYVHGVRSLRREHTMRKHRSRTAIYKALTFRASSIGDSLMGKYLLDNIHANFPMARLGIVVSSRSGMVKTLLKHYPWIEVIEVNRRNPKRIWKLWKTWRGSDVIVTQYAGRPAANSQHRANLLRAFWQKSWWVLPIVSRSIKCYIRTSCLFCQMSHQRSMSAKHCALQGSQ
jgi:FkbM family methyltransferase